MVRPIHRNRVHVGWTAVLRLGPAGTTGTLLQSNVGVRVQGKVNIDGGSREWRVIVEF